MYALIVSLFLLLPGMLEANPAFLQNPFAQTPITSLEQEPQQELSSISSGVQFKDALIRQQTQSHELSQEQRRFPALLSLLFLPENQRVEEASSLLPGASLSFSLTKDLLLLHHLLRI